MIDLKLYMELIESIAVSEKLQADLKLALEEAFENPQSFYDQDGEYLLAWRGLNFSESSRLTPKFVLTDKMIEANQMAEIDWKEDEAEIRPIINQILRAKNFDFNISVEMKYENEDTFKILDLINGNELKANGYSLKCLDIDSDSYVFTVVTADQEKRVTEMFEKLK
jgi:hypothetical protein